mmetsp:Transcript_9092/g.32209  ORF Transcript_9092/g.32209 Transcript_9092/m.32209 type:complete len:239 (-) Transcript_9092:1338-2054(-)
MALPRPHGAAAELGLHDGPSRGIVRPQVRPIGGATLAQQDLATALAGDALAQGVAQLHEGADLVGDHIQAASLDPSDQQVQIIRIRLGNDGLEEAASHVRGGRQFAKGLEVGVGDVLAASFQHLGRPIHIFRRAGPADAIKDQVEVFALQVLDPILLPEVDHAVGTQTEDPIDATRRHRRGDESTNKTCHLHRQVARPAVSAKHQHLGVARDLPQQVAFGGRSLPCKESLVRSQPGQR